MGRSSNISLRLRYSSGMVDSRSSGDLLKAAMATVLLKAARVVLIYRSLDRKGMGSSHDVTVGIPWPVVTARKYEEGVGFLSLLTEVSSASFSGQAASSALFLGWHLMVPAAQSMQHLFRRRNLCPRTTGAVVVGARSSSSLKYCDPSGNVMSVWMACVMTGPAVPSASVMLTGSGKGATRFPRDGFSFATESSMKLALAPVSTRVGRSWSLTFTLMTSSSHPESQTIAT